jgi:hypothetical protein
MATIRNKSESLDDWTRIVALDALHGLEGKSGRGEAEQ